ncbi:MAG: outer membrane beta-barrel protein [Rikenellaceae bacterium]
MKRVLFIVAIMVVALSQFTEVSAQEEAKRFEVGGKVNVYSNWGGAMGVGAYFRYNNILGNLRLEPSFLVFCDDNASLDLTADLQFPIEISTTVDIYPLVGISLNDYDVLGLGFNLGGGLDYSLTNRLNANFGLKWMVVTQRYNPNPLVFSVGLGYKF